MSGPGPYFLSSSSLLSTTNKGLALMGDKSLGRFLNEKFINKSNFKLLNNNPKDLPSHLKKSIPNATRQFIE